ncbi:MAG: hydroxyacid dehydrogenase [Sulfobacillus acidophilus]|uniref:Hydroxyacid dehydrogenase n=1 Tax=Sulfobacillus acidophilus TaxID=53633 RepID=A0A2T2WNL1_9FIRM|nr:MAG: hydroxyacid dehydrogenase [Sulfobacillus acidophilus]
MLRIVVAGGDTRDVWLCQMLRARGYDVCTWGIRAGSIPPFDPSHDIPPRLLIGPMTGITDDGRLQAAEEDITLSDQFLQQMGRGSLLAAGLIGNRLARRCRDLGIGVIQYRLTPSFMWLNAVPTAEGAIQAAIGRSGRTLFARPIGVIGLGRVGLILSDRLSRYGAQPIIFDRSGEKRAMARALGYPAYAIGDLPRPAIDGVFNTAPAPVLDTSWFDEAGPRWIIDLASIPGGLVPELRTSAVVPDRYEQILSIPGKVAPIRAAEIVFETLLLALEEEWHDGTPVGSAGWRRNGGLPL